MESTTSSDPNGSVADDDAFTNDRSPSNTAGPLPRPIKIALWLIASAIVLSVGNLVFFFYIFSHVPELPRQGIGLIVMMWLAMAILYGWFLTKMVQGRKWARVALTIAFALAFFSLMAQPEVSGDGYPVHFLSGFMTLSMAGVRLHNELLAYAPSIAIALAQLAALGFLFSPAAADWFREPAENEQ